MGLGLHGVILLFLVRIGENWVSFRFAALWKSEGGGYGLDWMNCNRLIVPVALC